jgi:glycosyltransferase involved in cell wall biosynthesis
VASSGPLVSVVIPTYNRSALLRRALESVRAQTYSNWEAIIVDDHSEDDTLAVVASYAEPRFRTTTVRSGGVIAVSRNHGIHLSRGALIAFLDSDDTWYPHKLERCLEVLTPDVDLVAHGLVYIRNGKEWMRKGCGPSERGRFERLLYDGATITTSAVVVRKEAVERVSGFFESKAEAGAEDYGLWVSLAKSGAKFALIDDMLGEYHVHAGNISKAASNLSAQFAVLDRLFSEIPCDSLRERLRRRRRKALSLYSVARGAQDDGEWREALALYWRGAVQWPFLAKLYAAALLTLVGWRRVPRPRGLAE